VTSSGKAAIATVLTEVALTASPAAPALNKKSRRETIYCLL
jgi:hypothetical protein